MAKVVSTKGRVLIAGTNFSDHCKRFTLDLGQETRDASAHGNTQRVHRAGVQTVSAECLFINDHASGSVESTLRALVVGSSSTGFAVSMRPTTAVQSTDNPTYSGEMIIDGPLNVLNHEHAELPEITVRFLPYSDITTYTSATS